MVACGSGAVRLNRLTCQVRGGTVDPATVTEAALPLLTGDEAARLTAALAAVVGGEAALRKALKSMAPAAVPGAAGEGALQWQTPFAGDLPALALAASRALGLDNPTLPLAAEPGCRAICRIGCRLG